MAAERTCDAKTVIICTDAVAAVNVVVVVIVVVAAVAVHPRTGYEGPKGEQRYRSTVSLISKLDGVGGQCNAPANLLQEMRSGTHCTGGWVSSWANLDGCRISRPHQDLIPRLSTRRNSL